MDNDDLNGDFEEEEELVRVLLRNAFGESSSSSSSADDDEDTNNTGGGGGGPAVFNWESIREIDGLWICKGFLSPDQQSSLLCSIHKEGWLSYSSSNQAMRFGDLPSWAVELSNSIREAVFFSHGLTESAALSACDATEEGSPLPSDLLWREPLFDQLIMNTYEPGEGICAHVDLMRFEDGIAIVSLESSCIMHFTRADHEELAHNTDANNCHGVRIPVHLTEGSLVLMSGEARYQWKHEINRKPGFQIWKGRELDQRKRTSITLRKLCPTSVS